MNSTDQPLELCASEDLASMVVEERRLRARADAEAERLRVELRESEERAEELRGFREEIAHRICACDCEERSPHVAVGEPVYDDDGIRAALGDMTAAVAAGGDVLTLWACRRELTAMRLRAERADTEESVAYGDERPAWAVRTLRRGDAWEARAVARLWHGMIVERAATGATRAEAIEELARELHAGVAARELQLPDSAARIYAPLGAP